MFVQRLKRFLLVVGASIAGFAALIVLGITFTIGWTPILGPDVRPVQGRWVKYSPERAQRGKYLVDAVAGCFGCHTTFDSKVTDVPRMTGKRGSGRVWVRTPSLLLSAPNITPDSETGIGTWTDDEIGRAIREGIAADGHALFPMMPYTSYKNISDDDLAAIIIYLRTVDPERNYVPPTEVPFPVSRIINIFPEPITDPVPPPDTSDMKKRGEYLVQLADCGGCHTPRGKTGSVSDELGFAGGSLFTEFGDTVASTNITPDPSGIPYYDEELFLSVMRTGHVKSRALSPSMPWWVFREMTDTDLRAIFEFIKDLTPVKHLVSNSDPPTECKLCKNKHGLGDQNDSHD